MRFTETDTARFYDAEDAHYRSFWDEDGSLHWGYFDDPASEDFVGAGRRWTRLMIDRSNLTADARVLDVGCGNGTSALAVCRATGASVTGIDLSAVRVGHAAASARLEAERSCRFLRGSATALPFAGETFTHAWSQATLYHVPDRRAALREIHRVLGEGGTLALDDLVTPTSRVGDVARTYVYDRLLFEPGGSHEDYVRVLVALGFVVYGAEPLTPHLRRSYELLAARARPRYPRLAHAYERMCEAIDQGELGWSFFLCEKVTDRLRWIYADRHPRPLRDRYDAWARTYDADLDAGYRTCPRTAARLLARHVPRRGARVLDAGCGTGMCGEELRRLGFSTLIGADLSPGMLAGARAKGAYAELAEWDMGAEPPPWQPSVFDGLVATGVFTFNHAPPSALAKLDALLKPGAVAVLTFRDDYFAALPEARAALDALPWTAIGREPVVIFDGEPMQALAFRKR